METECRLPTQPVIPEAVLRRDQLMGGRYEGDIKPGMVFAWEPDLPHARELCVVTRITGPGEDEMIKHARGTAIISGGYENRVWTRRMNGGLQRDLAYLGHREVWNDVSRFREAVVPTKYRDQLV